MNKKVIEKIIQKFKSISNKRWEQALLLFSFGLVVFLATRMPINPDEYLYVAIGNNLSESFRGNACFGCINTYHTFLAPLLLAFFNFITGINSFIIYRIIFSLFSIGSIFFLYKIFKLVFKKPAFNPLFLILLFPGFFYHSGMILIDNAAFFFFTVLIYLLIKKDSYWKVGILVALTFFAKEYYIVFCGFVVSVVIFYDALVENKNEKTSWKIKFIFKNFIASFLFSFLLLLSIILFPILPYPSLLETFLIEASSGFYFKIGKFLNEILYIDENGIKKETIQQLFNNNAVVHAIKNNFFIAVKRFNEGAFEYWKMIFKEIQINLHVFPLFLYGIYVAFKNKSIFLVSRERKTIIMLSILAIFFISFARTATIKIDGFRVAFILIIPFIYFSYLAINHILQKKKNSFDVFIFLVLAFIYILIYFLGIQKTITSGSLLASSPSFFVQAFIKYKFLFNLIFYGFPVCIIIFNLQTKTKKIILLLWLIIAFSYKITPEILNSYLVEKKSSIEYNLENARDILSEVEEEEPRILTNYMQAYYYYSDSLSMPNNERKSLPVIRPKPLEIYEDRFFAGKEGFEKVDKSFLCERDIDYILYVNRGFIEEGIEKKIEKISGIKIRESFYKNNNLNWIIYKFDKGSCK